MFKDFVGKVLYHCYICNNGRQTSKGVCFLFMQENVYYYISESSESWIKRH